MKAFNMGQYVQNTEISKKKDDTLYSVEDVYTKYGARLREEGVFCSSSSQRKTAMPMTKI